MHAVHKKKKRARFHGNLRLFAHFTSFSRSLSQVRLQTQPKPKPGESLLYAGTIDCCKKTLAKEVSMHTDANSGIY